MFHLSKIYLKRKIYLQFYVCVQPQGRTTRRCKGATVLHIHVLMYLSLFCKTLYVFARIRKYLFVKLKIK